MLDHTVFYLVFISFKYIFRCVLDPFQFLQVIFRTIFLPTSDTAFHLSSLSCFLDPVFFGLTLLESSFGTVAQNLSGFYISPA